MFLKRALTVLIALPVFAAALLLLPQRAWALFLLPGLAVAAWEWAGLAAYSRTSRGAYAALLTISAAAIFYLGPEGTSAGPTEIGLYVLACTFWFVIAPFWLRGHWSVRNAWVLGAVGWLVLVPMWLALVRLQATPWALLGFMAIVWIADTAAYLTGRAWGRHKLAPRVSPGKSWEGVAGAAAAVAFYYVALWLTVPVEQRLFAPAAGAVVFAVLLALSIEGDLFESWMKREAGVKDSGQILPGHGGILDRIDALTSTMPAAALALYLL